METMIESIDVQNDHGIVPVTIRMPNGDLKRKFLMSMLKKGAVLPQVAVNKILLEVLYELDRVFDSRRAWAEKALELQSTADAMGEKWEGEVETCEALNSELCEEMGDMGADMAQLYFERRVSEVEKAEEPQH